MVKPKTPEQLATKAQGKDKYTLYLSRQTMDEVKARASKAGISASLIVDEAIASYLKSLK